MNHIPMNHIPMEWMDPMSWRLPSGKALAEFALQAGFLAPLILHGPRAKVRTVVARAPASPVAESSEDPSPTNGRPAGGYRGTRS